MSASLTPTPEAHDTAQAYFRSLLESLEDADASSGEQMIEGGRTAVRHLFRRGRPHLIERLPADAREMRNWRRKDLTYKAPVAEQ